MTDGLTSVQIVYKVDINRPLSITDCICTNLSKSLGSILPYTGEALSIPVLHLKEACLASALTRAALTVSNSVFRKVNKPTNLLKT